MQKIAEIRTEYTKATLDISTIDADPVQQFAKWLDEALTSNVSEPTAMNLATVNEHGRPSSRIVLLKGMEEKKFLFYTNYQSQKGKEIDQNPACALTFFWPELERQIRIEGTATRVDESVSDKYFKSRPLASQVGAWASPQSSFIQNREILDQRVKQIEQRFTGLTVLPRPHQWGGFEVMPFLFEFWQGRASRLHDRLQYTLIDGVWQVQRLAP